MPVETSLARERADQSELAIMTFNLRFDTSRDGPNQWSKRRANVAGQFALLRPHVICTQEGLVHQLDFLEQELASYRRLGVGRDDGVEGGEFNAVFYDSRAVDLLSESTFWLSETPDRPSKGWDGRHSRICTYARFEGRSTGRRFWVFNTHLEQEGGAARLEGARLILQRIADLNTANEPCLLTGDFNAEPGALAAQLVTGEMNDARQACTGAVFGPEATFNGFEVNTRPHRRIDYIFTSRSNVEVADYGVLSFLVDGRYLSDHFAVYARCRLV